MFLNYVCKQDFLEYIIIKTIKNLAKPNVIERRMINKLEIMSILNNKKHLF